MNPASDNNMILSDSNELRPRIYDTLRTVVHPDTQTLINQIRNLKAEILTIFKRQDSTRLSELRKHVNNLANKNT